MKFLKERNEDLEKVTIIVFCSHHLFIVNIVML